MGIAVITVWFAGAGFVYSAGDLYSKAIEFSEAGSAHFAFMHFNKLLRNYPESKYRQDALFATGEYYFETRSFHSAQKTFKTYLDEYPDSEETIYILAYLLHIAQRDKDLSLAGDLEKKIIDLQQVSFVFRDSKEMTYRSPLNKKYKAMVRIDKIEFYLEGDLFAQVSY